MPSAYLTVHRSYVHDQCSCHRLHDCDVDRLGRCEAIWHHMSFRPSARNASLAKLSLVRVVTDVSCRPPPGTEVLLRTTKRSNDTSLLI